MCAITRSFARAGQPRPVDIGEDVDRLQDLRPGRRFLADFPEHAFIRTFLRGERRDAGQSQSERETNQSAAGHMSPRRSA
jgi:hypothetical protein